MKFTGFFSILIIISSIILYELSFAGQDSISITSQMRYMNMVSNYSDIIHEERDIQKDLSIYEKPPLNPVRIGGEVVIGEALGCLYGFTLLFITGPISTGSSDCPGDDVPCGLETAFVFAYIGYLVGNAHGVYLVGSGGDETGSFWGSMGGSLAGALLGISLAWETDGVTALTLPVVGATTTFNLSRRYKNNRRSLSLINLENGGLRFGYPQISIAQKRFDSGYSTNLSLFQIEF